jgi:hypothetical protein
VTARVRLRLLTWLAAVLAVVASAVVTARPAAAAALTVPSPSTTSSSLSCSAAVVLTVAVVRVSPSTSGAVQVLARNRVKGISAGAAKGRGATTQTSLDGVGENGLHVRWTAVGVTVYVNGDPINLSDPNGHVACRLGPDCSDSTARYADIGAQNQSWLNYTVNAQLGDIAGASDPNAATSLYKNFVTTYPTQESYAQDALGIAVKWAYETTPDLVTRQLEQFLDSGWAQSLIRFSNWDAEHHHLVTIGTTAVVVAGASLLTGGAAAAATGGVIEAAGGSALLTGVVSGAAGGVVSSATAQLITTGGVDLKTTLGSGALGGVLGGVSPALGLIRSSGAGAPATAPSLFRPGPFAEGSVPSGGPGSVSAAEQRGVNALGDQYGCHSCGASEPGTTSGNWVGDHQPVSRWADGQPQALYPQCLACSRQQGLDVINALRQGYNPYLDWFGTEP